MKQLNPRDWDNFWIRANVTSLEGADNYNHEILDFWSKHLQKGMQHVVDLATGNGALVWIANNLLNQPTANCRITGVDLASTNPFETLKKKPSKYPMVNFINNTSIEELPFEDSSIDIIISQWGLEYSNLSNSIPEASRVLRPRSMMAFICHYENSDVLKDSNMKLDKLIFILEKGEIFDCYLELDMIYNTYTKIEDIRADSRHQKVIVALNKALHEVQYFISQSKDPSINIIPEALNSLSQLFSSQSAMKQPHRANRIIKIRDNIQATIARISDLKAAALSLEECDELEELITDNGFKMIERRPIVHNSLGDIGMGFAAMRGAI